VAGAVLCRGRRTGAEQRVSENWPLRG